MAVYVDTSALVKLIRLEAETAALRDYLGGHPDLVASVVASIELARSVRRAGEGEELLEPVLHGLILVSLTNAIVERAKTLGPPGLRTLDAIHVATALEIGPELEALVTYDNRLAEAAELEGITIARPPQTG